MIFVDTNYFLRLLLADVEAQHLDSKELFLKAARGEVKLITSTLVFFETAWVLRSTYHQDKESVIDSLHKILSLNVEIMDRDLLIQCLYLFRNSNHDILDCYNLSFAAENNLNDFKTFDKKLSREFAKLVGKKV